MTVVDRIRPESWCVAVRDVVVVEVDGGVMSSW